MSPGIGAPHWPLEIRLKQAEKALDRYDRLKEAGKREKLPSKEPTSQRKPRQPNATDQAQQIAKQGDKVGAVAKLLGG